MIFGKEGGCYHHTVVLLLLLCVHYSFHGTLQRHCIVVTNRDIYPGACEQSAKHVGKTATQLAQELGQVYNYSIDV